MSITFSVAGVTHGALSDAEFPNETERNDFDLLFCVANLRANPENEHDPNAIRVELWLADDWDEDGDNQDLNWRVWHIGYVPAALLATAHADNWCDRDWAIAAIGTWTPPGQHRTVPYCRLTSEDAPTQHQ